MSFAVGKIIELGLSSKAPAEEPQCAKEPSDRALNAIARVTSMWPSRDRWTDAVVDEWARSLDALVAGDVAWEDVDRAITDLGLERLDYGLQLGRLTEAAKKAGRVRRDIAEARSRARPRLKSGSPRAAAETFAWVAEMRRNGSAPSDEDVAARYREACSRSDEECES